MNIFKSVLLFLLTIPSVALAMEVDRSEYYSSDIYEQRGAGSRSVWNSLDSQVHCEHFSSLVDPNLRVHILSNLVERSEKLKYTIDKKKSFEVTVYRGGEEISLTSRCTVQGKSVKRKINFVAESQTGKYVGLLVGDKQDLIKVIEMNNEKSFRIFHSPGLSYCNLFFSGDRYLVGVRSDSVGSSKQTLRCIDLEKDTITDLTLDGFPHPLSEKLWLCSEWRGGSCVILHTYDIEKQESISSIHLDSDLLGLDGFFSCGTMSKDGNRIAVEITGKSKITGEEVVTIVVFDQYAEKGELKWRRMAEIKTAANFCSFLRFSPTDVDHILLWNRNDREEGKEACYDLKRAARVDRFVLRNMHSTLTERECHEDCRSIKNQQVSEKIRVIDLLRGSLINHIFKNYPGKALLCKRDSDLLENGFPESFKKILKSLVNIQPVEPVNALTLTSPYIIKNPNWFGQTDSKKHYTENEEEPKAKKACLSKENNQKSSDKQEESLTDEEAAFDKFMRETQGYMD